ncbi:MAG: TMEM165/GDT1 family protein [Candidatus Hadarchaeota archaeon]
MDLTALISSFILIALAELGDKTQLTVMTLCTKHKPQVVLVSSFLALLGIGGISIVIGSAITHILPIFWIKIGSGAAFFIFGTHTLLDKEEHGLISCREITFAASFLLV